MGQPYKSTHRQEWLKWNNGVRHQLQVDERRLDRGVPQPPTQVVDLGAADEQVASVAVPQGVRAYLAPGRARAQFLSPPDRRSGPPPRRPQVNIDEIPWTVPLT